MKSMPDTPERVDIPSLLHSGLLNTIACKRIPVLNRIWDTAWRTLANRVRDPVHSTIHGFAATHNFGYTYPIYARLYPTYNAPLLELAYQCYAAKGAPISLVDVGAAIGDTIMLLYANCEGMLGSYTCIDGDPEFFAYLQANLSGVGSGKLFQAVLAAEPRLSRTLVHIHDGTASAQGDALTPATTLDLLASQAAMDSLDLLKIDVDGYDGQVLKGAQQVIESFQPAVIFEWHPLLCQQTGNNWLDHFAVLAQLEYTRYHWYDNYGRFRKETGLLDEPAILSLAENLLDRKDQTIDYYDVIALHAASSLPAAPLAELRFAANRRSPF